MNVSLETGLSLLAEPPVVPVVEVPGASWRDRLPRAAAAVGAILLIFGAGLAGYRWWSSARLYVTTDNATIAANVHLISARIPGTVLEVVIQDNQRVSANAPLLRMDPSDLDLGIQQARNGVAQAAARRTQAEARLREARAQSAQTAAKASKAEAEAQKARLDLDRARHLTEDGRFAAISRQDVDAFRAADDVAQASVRLAEADGEATRALVKSAEANCAIAEADLRMAEVQLAEAELQRSYTVVSAPVNGTIGRRNVETGQRVQPGQALLAVVAEGRWIVANFKETQVGRMRVGQSVRIEFDAFPKQHFAGRVESFSPASGARFALLPPDNATGNFTKIVQRIPVKIVLEPGSLRGFADKLVAGMSAVVHVRTS